MSPNLSKSQLVIFDTGPIIGAFQANAWNALVDFFDIQVAEIVVQQEAFFFVDAAGKKVDIDLKPYIQSGKIKVISAQAAEAATLKNKFDPTYIERLHAGELESLCCLMRPDASETLVCSADSIVYKVLGYLRLAHQGVSLEELLARIGHKKPPEWKYSKDFREKNTDAGRGDGMIKKL